MAYEEYGWGRYYEDIYHRQKKKNNALAVELGEITAKTDEARIALERVTNSSLWKALSPARKLYHLVKKDASEGTSGSQTHAMAPDSDSLYGKRLWMYEDYYSQWIRRDPVENQYASYAGSGMEKVREAKFHIVYIEDCAGLKAPFDASIRAPWILFTSKKGELARGYAERLDSILSDKPDALIAYADEDFYYRTSEGAGMHRIEPFFKPDWSPDTLDSFFYFGNAALMRSSAAIRADWFGSSDGFLNVYDLFLQVSEKCGKHYDDPGIVHIPQVLFHNRYSEDADKDAVYNDSYDNWLRISSQLKDDLGAGKYLPGAGEEAEKVRKRAAKRRHLSISYTPGQFPGVSQICYQPESDPKISVVILSKDHPEVLKELLESFVERTDYDRKKLEFIIVDNGSTAVHREEYSELIDSCLNDIGHKYIYKEMNFNFSAMCNIGAAEATGELILFMNDDIKVIQKDWLRLMAGYALLPHVGLVGAKLLYDDSDLIQHAGITSMIIGPSHKLVIYPDDRIYYYGRNALAYDCIGVTAACMMVAADKMDNVGYFDEAFPVAYNDVELNFRFAKSGYVNLQCNGSVLYHCESLTRGADEGDDDKWDRLLNEKERLYQIYPEFLGADPYYNPNLIGNHSNYLSNYDFGYNNHLKCEVIRQIDASNLAEIPAGNLRIAIDFAGLQSKINLKEPEITEIRGWSFMHGEDNSAHIVNLILKNEVDGTTYRVETDPVPRIDLEETFPDEKNNRLCGFECRMLRDDLAAGTYRVGVEPTSLNHDLNRSEPTGKVVYTDTILTV